MRTAIITGANGQDGFYLAKLLSHYGVEPVTGIGGAPVCVTDFRAAADMVQDTKPEFIFHLAAKSTVAHESAIQNHHLFANGTFNILEAVKDYAPECRVFLAGSAYQFLNVGNVIKETDPWDTRNVYCAGRGYMNLLARAYRAMGLHVYFGYFFHHDSPRRHARHLSSRIAAAARERKTIEIDHPAFVKEWTWAGDTVEAIWSLVNQEAVWEANIGTGIGRSVAEFADACYRQVGLHWQDYVLPKYDFKSEQRRLVCDPERIYSTGWRPRYDLEYLAKQMVNV